MQFQFIEKMEVTEETLTIQNDIKAVMGRAYEEFDRRILPIFYKQIPIGQYYLSIQCNFGLKCTPTETLEDLSKYSTMEVALVDSSGKFIRIKDALPNFNEEIEECFNGRIYGYVPVEMIEELYQALLLKDNIFTRFKRKAKYNLKGFIYVLDYLLISAPLPNRILNYSSILMIAMVFTNNSKFLGISQLIYLASLVYFFDKQVLKEKPLFIYIKELRTIYKYLAKKNFKKKQYIKGLLYLVGIPFILIAFIFIFINAILQVFVVNN